MENIFSKLAELESEISTLRSAYLVTNRCHEDALLHIRLSAASAGNAAVRSAVAAQHLALVCRGVSAAGMASGYPPVMQALDAASLAMEQAVLAASEAAQSASAALEATQQSEQAAIAVSAAAAQAVARASSAAAAAAQMAYAADPADPGGRTVSECRRCENEWEAEIKRLAQHLFHIDRQRVVGHMSAALGHELNQPLAAILTTAQVVQRGLRSKQLQEEKAQELLERIAHSTVRASAIIDGVRTFIRPTAGSRQKVDLHEVVRESLELMQPDACLHKVQISWEEGAGPVPVQCDKVQLSQVLVNVLRNAIDALAPEPHRAVRIQMRQTSEQVSLSITDSGPGLTPQQLQKVGTPFYSTKSSGLGMGLSISQKIIGDHRGTLTIGNAENAGARVIVTLPLAA